MSIYGIYNYSLTQICLFVIVVNIEKLKCYFTLNSATIKSFVNMNFLFVNLQQHVLAEQIET